MAKSVRDFTEDLLQTTAEFALFALFYGLEVSFSGSRGLTFSGSDRAGENALATLEGLDTKKILRSIRYLKQKGLVAAWREKAQQIKITEAGMRRLAAQVPHFDDRRYWDGYLYLVTYDIPVTNNPDRNSLRDFLKKIGCGQFQDSVWVTPYDPRELVDEFVKAKNLEGTILVSVLAPDKRIGGLDVGEFLEKVYDLRGLSARYETFIEQVRTNPNKIARVLEYYAILRDDPQLPFNLLPRWWMGDQAYRIFDQVLGGTKGLDV